MNALTYGDYLGIAIFTIGLWYGVKIVWELVGEMIDNYLRKKRYAPSPMKTLNLLRISYRFKVTKAEVEKALQDDIEQGVIASYTLGDDFIVCRHKSGNKKLIDLSKYDVE